jgi:hypothetical protein
MRFAFDWDFAKEQANIRKHHLAFRQAATVFRDPNQVSIYDDEHSGDEERWVTMGLDSAGVLRVVVHTFGEAEEDAWQIRIISARCNSGGSTPISRERHMKKEYDFSNGKRGKFYRPNAVYAFPVYLEADVNDFVSRLAEQRNVDVQVIVNDLLRADMQLVQQAQ